MVRDSLETTNVARLRERTQRYALCSKRELSMSSLGNKTNRILSIRTRDFSVNYQGTAFSDSEYSTNVQQVNNVLSFGNLLWWYSYTSTYLLSFRNLPFMDNCMVLLHAGRLGIEVNAAPQYRRMPRADATRRARELLCVHRTAILNFVHTSVLG